MAAEIIVLGLVALAAVVCIAVIGVVALISGGTFRLMARDAKSSRVLDVEASGGQGQDRSSGN